MSAPTPTARVTPTGNMLENGFRSLITFALDTNIDLWEKQVTAPAYDGGDAIDITTMHNVEVMTKDLNALYEIGDITMVCAYSRRVYADIRLLINRNTTITQLFPDGGTAAFFGGLRSFTPNALARGNQPEATVVIVITNIDPVTGGEELPVFSAAVGTP